MFSIIVLVLQVALVTPLIVLSGGRGHLAPKLGIFYAGLLIVLIGVNEARSDLPADGLAIAAPEQNDGGTLAGGEDCTQLLGLSRQLELFGDIENDTVPVAGRLWDQMPEAVQTALLTCLSRTANDGRALEVVKR